MPQLNLSKIFVAHFNHLGAPYFITGAVASIIYGEPRLTNDLDLVVRMQTDDVERFLRL